MNVSKEELLHIAKLANLKLKNEEIDKYLTNLQDILNFTNVLNEINTDNIDETIGSTDNCNILRDDKIIDFKDKELLLANCEEVEDNMFKIPKVIN